MSHRSSRSGVILLTGLALCLAGLALTLHSLQVTPVLRKQIRAKQERLERLTDLREERGQAQAQAGFAAFIAREHTTPPALAVVIEKLLPNIQPDIVEFEPQAAAHGTRVLKANVNVGLVDLAKVNSLLDTLERHDPPWRIVECTVQAAAGQRGKGRVMLALEALEKL